MKEVTETLELKLVEPNAHKHRKLCETKTAYQQALEAAFSAGCTAVHAYSIAYLLACAGV
jgi:putative transposase